MPLLLSGHGGMHDDLNLNKWQSGSKEFGHIAVLVGMLQIHRQSGSSGSAF